VHQREPKVAQRLYFPASMLCEIDEEAARTNRTLSWIVQKAWILAREEIRALPPGSAAPLPRFPGEHQTPT